MYFRCMWIFFFCNNVCFPPYGSSLFWFDAYRSVTMSGAQLLPFPKLQTSSVTCGLPLWKKERFSVLGDGQCSYSFPSLWDMPLSLEWSLVNVVIKMVQMVDNLFWVVCYLLFLFKNFSSFLFTSLPSYLLLQFHKCTIARTAVSNNPGFRHLVTIGLYI